MADLKTALAAAQRCSQKALEQSDAAKGN